MNLQKRIASQLLKCSPKKIKLDPTRMKDIEEAITKKDVRGLINQGALFRVKTQAHSRGRSRLIKIQKRKGKRKGPGSRKGKLNSRLGRKTRWMNTIRAQREFLKGLKKEKKLDIATFNELYQKSKGGFFRSVRHITIYIEEHGLHATK